MEGRNERIAARFIEGTELYPNKKLQIILILGLSAAAFFLVVGAGLGVALAWFIAVPLIILGAVAFAGTMASALAVGPHIGLHRDFLLWRLVGNRYNFMRWEEVNAVETGGPADCPTLIVVKGVAINGRPAAVRINPRNYRRGSKLLDEIVRRFEWVQKRA